MNNPISLTYIILYFLSFVILNLCKTYFCCLRTDYLKRLKQKNHFKTEFRKLVQNSNTFCAVSKWKNISFSLKMPNKKVLNFNQTDICRISKGKNCWNNDETIKDNIKWINKYWTMSFGSYFYPQYDNGNVHNNISLMQISQIEANSNLWTGILDNISSWEYWFSKNERVITRIKMISYFRITWNKHSLTNISIIFKNPNNRLVRCYFQSKQPR